MAWLYKQKGSDNWWIGYRLNGKQYLRSTKTSDETKAKQELNRLELINQAHQAGSLTEEFFRLISNRSTTNDTLTGYVKQWLAECKDLSPNTLERYEKVLEEFCTYIKADERAPLLRDVRSEAISAFLRTKRAFVSTTTIRLYRRIMVSFFNYAVENQVLQVTPVPSSRSLKLVKTRGGKSPRRSLTLEEVKLLYKKCPSDFWRYMVLGGFYTALRMGDLIMMPWGAVDFAENTINTVSRKTNTPVHIPMRPAFREMLEKLKKKSTSAKPTDYIWPEQAELYERRGAKAFSNDFYDDVLLPAGLVTKRTHKPKKRKDGEVATVRQINPVSFHSLRHTFITTVKITGGSQAVAKELAGHTTDAISDLYTHASLAELSKAIRKLPEVTR